MREDIAAGIVLFNPNLERLEQNLKAVSGQVLKIFLIDNGSENIHGIQQLLQEYSVCRLLRNEINKGVAVALNQLMKEAENNGYTWLLTLDDDSVCENGLVQKLSAFTERPDVGIICADATDDSMTNSGSVNKHSIRSEKDGCECVESCITAGSLTSIRAWKTIGGFDERMFIDFVDVEYCTRLRTYGYQIWKVAGTKVHQQYGNISGHFHFLGKMYYLFNYPPIRIYYSVRNQIYYLKKHGKVICKSRQLFFLVGYVGKRIIFEKDRYKSLCAVIRGVKDGIRMRV